MADSYQMQPELEVRRTSQRFVVERSSQVPCCTIHPAQHMDINEINHFIRHEFQVHTAACLVNECVIILNNSQSTKPSSRYKAICITTTQTMSSCDTEPELITTSIIVILSVLQFCCPFCFQPFYCRLSQQSSIYFFYRH